MARQYAGILGTLAFLTVLARAFFSGEDLAGGMQAALLALAVFAAVGGVVGGLAKFLVDDEARNRLKRELESKQEQNQQATATG